MRQVVIIGGGFAGLAALRRLYKRWHDFDITLIDKKRTFSFSPVLPDIIGERIPSRFLSFAYDDLVEMDKCKFVHDEVVRVDLDKRIVYSRSDTYFYDYLIIATGCETAFYGNDAIKKHSFKLDTVEDADTLYRTIRSGTYETFVVAGCGYTGIEVATNLRRYLTRHKKRNRILIVEKLKTFLPDFPEKMRQYIWLNLEKLKIDVALNTTVEKIDGETIGLSNDETIYGAMLIWTAGVKGADFASTIDIGSTPQGRVYIDRNLKIRKDCFAVGDAAHFPYEGKPLRMAVQFAITQGETAAGNVFNSADGLSLDTYEPFDLGYVIPLANNKACGKIVGMTMCGFIPIALHYFFCSYRSCGMKNKMGILKSFLKSFFK